MSISSKIAEAVHSRSDTVSNILIEMFDIKLVTVEVILDAWMLGCPETYLEFLIERDHAAKMEPHKVKSVSSHKVVGATPLPTTLPKTVQMYRNLFTDRRYFLVGKVLMLEDGFWSSVDIDSSSIQPVEVPISDLTEAEREFATRKGII